MEVQTTAYGAFESQLKTLCLNEFPCGIGTWIENYGKKRKHIAKDKVNSKFLITLKDYGAHHEKTETLEELVTAKLSPWNMDYSWSDEARRLREIAVRSPWLVDHSFVLRHFKTLRIVDKGVTEVDPEISQFTCLEELFLSVNQLCTVNSAHLPPGLKVLELAANNISNLGDLCMQPPPLIHLGLGYNSLALVEDYITGNYWPHLLSLDLSHNNLCDLMEIVNKLQSLPKLGNLVLQGNPLSLLAAYRGFTIDCLKQLNYLDDSTISADERHVYKGLAKKKEHILDEVKVSLHVASIKGVPVPEEIKNPEDQPEYPIITRKYFVQFMYPQEASNQPDILLVINENEPSKLTSASQDRDAQTPGAELNSSGSISDAQAPEIHITDSSPLLGSTLRKSSHSSEDQPNHSEEGTPSIPEPDLSDDPKLLPVKSTLGLWAEEIPLQWTSVVARDDLLAVRNFYKTGMEVCVCEELVRSFPPDQVEAPPSPSPSRSQVGKKKEAQAAPTKAANKPGDKNDGKKKKKEAEIDLVHMPPEYSTLATFHMPLEGFLDGEYKLKKHFSLDWELGPRATTPTSSEVSSRKVESKDSGKDSKEKKKKPGSAGSRAGKAGKGGKKEEKPKNKVETIEDEGPPTSPPPLEILVSVRLHHWTTAYDCMRPDPDEAQAQEGTA